MLISKDFRFEAAHYLPHYHGSCERLHGHSYRLEIAVAGEPGPDGMVLDFRLLKRLVKERVVDVCDHRLLNDFIPNPTAELLAWWTWDRIEAALPSEVRLASVTVWETCEARAMLRHDDVVAARAAGTVPTGSRLSPADTELRASKLWGCERCRHADEVGPLPA